jgi:hypothetical protein
MMRLCNRNKSISQVIIKNNMKLISRYLVFFIVFCGCVQALAEIAVNEDRVVRVVSWNISGDSFVTDTETFQAMMRHTQPDVLILDEVLPSATAEQLSNILADIDPEDERVWNVEFGLSGGRQRGVIASRWPLERPFSFNRVIPYPEEESWMDFDCWPYQLICSVVEAWWMTGRKTVGKSKPKKSEG